MSTKAVLETYDTQMLDYSGDIDVPMHGSVEPWFHTEAPMEDDGQILTQPYPSDHESVEVDMERPYEGEYTEYEMAEEVEAGSHHGESTELVDIDVYDASHAPTPAVVPIELNPLPTDSVVVTAELSQPVFTDPNTSSLPSSTDRDVVAEDHGESTTEYGHEPPTTVANPSILIPPHLDLNSPQVGAVDADFLAGYSAAPEAHSDPTVSSEGVEFVGHHATPLSPAEGGAAPEVQDTANTYYANNSDHEDAVSARVEDLPHVTQSPKHIEAATEDTTDADPHEISEGVYIDPPPAVLLNLPFSEQTKFCLFNQPSPSSSPSAEGSQHKRQGFTLLLHHRPTLYYEPLANVFEAFRQDEHIGNIPEIFEGELVLDAYDLQLVISEDNFFAREITLHDLNVLHDGSDFSGPLRIQLQSVIPRFITRYRLLQDQIARLNMVTVTGEEIPEKENYQEYRPEIAHSTDGEQLDEHPYEELQDGQPEAEEQEHHLEDQRAQHYHQYQEQNSEDPREPKPEQNSEAQGHSDVDSFGSIGEPLNASSEGYEVETDDTGFVLEGDNEHASAGTKQSDESEVHEVADTEVGDEHTVYEEYPTDNDDLYAHPDAEEAFVDTADFDQGALDGNAQHFTTESLLPEEASSSRGSSHGSDSSSTGRRRSLAEHDRIGQSHAENFEGPAQSDHEGEDDAETEHHSSGTVFGEGSLTEPHEVNESVSGAVTSLDQEDDTADPSSSTQHPLANVTVDPEIVDDQEWDDNLDGEGEADTTWTPDDHDAKSNESSVTLSSITSKRNHSEFEEDDFDDVNETVATEISPGSKRPRVY
jgi:hypothetical protein